MYNPLSPATLRALKCFERVGFLLFFDIVGWKEMSRQRVVVLQDVVYLKEKTLVELFGTCSGKFIFKV